MSFEAMKRLASLLTDFLKESFREKVNLKLSSSLVLAGGVVVMLPSELINAIESGWFTKEMQSVLAIELNMNDHAS